MEHRNEGALSDDLARIGEHVREFSAAETPAVGGASLALGPGRVGSCPYHPLDLGGGEGGGAPLELEECLVGVAAGDHAEFRRGRPAALS